MGCLTMLLGLKMREALALLTLICQVAAAAAEAYTAIPLNNANEGNIIARSEQVDRVGGMKLCED
jgi:hypothetical protein